MSEHAGNPEGRSHRFPILVRNGGLNLCKGDQSVMLQIMGKTEGFNVFLQAGGDLTIIAIEIEELGGNYCVLSLDGSQRLLGS